MNLYERGKQILAEREAAIRAAGNVPPDTTYGLSEGEHIAGLMLNALQEERDAMLDCLKALAARLEGEAGFEIAMENGFDAELFAIRVMIAQAEGDA